MGLLTDDFFDDTLDPEIEDYFNFLDEDEQDQTGFLTKKRVNEHFEEVGNYLNFFMVYPDYFVDLITPKSSHFHLFFFQRIIMRCMARGNNSYMYFSLRFVSFCPLSLDKQRAQSYNEIVKIHR